ncbi:hypothetical protein NDU88_006019 [Pleurodeles waltl]|uniref:Uncharacterized protein n=1 Tax=Pleurodeles waltl TaxID=8319 RepID=A0AAV7ULT2_PLEWA|nr:hypothetical protein NDU88_006019 [Pleurodeles waltl]
MDWEAVENLTRELAALTTNPGTQQQGEAMLLGENGSAKRQEQKHGVGRRLQANLHSPIPDILDYPERTTLVIAFLLAYALGKASTTLCKPPY